MASSATQENINTMDNPLVNGAGVTALDPARIPPAYPATPRSQPHFLRVANYPPIMIDPTDPVRRYQSQQVVQLKLSNGQWIRATIAGIARPSPNAASQQYTVEYTIDGRRETTCVGPAYLRPSTS